jgi:TPR repeat protein
MHTLSLLVGLAFLGTAEARKPKAVGATPSANAGEIPALAELLDRTGWTPTPELSGAFQAGHVFRATDMGHRLVTDTCVASKARESTYTETAMLTSLQAGVSVGVGQRAAVTAGITKKVKFGTPTHHAIPELELAATEDCATRLKRLPSLDGMYVVQEVLMATITEQTCGSLDASGRFVSGLANVDASVQQACAQASLEPVAVGYRTAPMTSLLGGAVPSPVAASPQPVKAVQPTPGGGTDCVRVQTDTENSVREQQRDKAVAADHRSLDMDYGSMRIDDCQEKSDLYRELCANRLDTWMTETRNQQTTVSGGTHKVQTACGVIKVKLGKEKVATGYDLARAEAALAQLRKPSPAALFSLALENFKSGDKQRMREAVDQFIDACERGETSSCQWAGNRFMRDDVVPPDHPRARILYTRGCDNGSGPSCWELGLMFEKAQGGPEDRGRAYATFETGCGLDHTSSCTRGANMLRNGDGTKADPVRAMQQLAELCEGEDNPAACTYAAWGWRDGTGVEEDTVKAVSLYRRSCNDGYGHGCNEGAYLLDEGVGALSVDDVEATRLYTLGCELDHSMSCYNLAYQYQGGEGVTKSQSKADALLKKACDLGKEDACK